MWIQDFSEKSGSYVEGWGREGEGTEAVTLPLGLATVIERLMMKAF